MKGLTGALAVVLAATLAGGEGDEAAPTAEQLVADVVAQLPQEPLVVGGKLYVRAGHGRQTAAYGFRMRLDWGANPSTAVYTILDADGQPLEQMTVSRHPGKDAEFSYAAGPDLEPAPLPALHTRIRETDLSWLDLSLSFLWWRPLEVLGTDSVKGQKTYVVLLAAPEAGAGTYHQARLWIDAKMHMLLQAEALDGNGEPVRKLWVKSFKQIGEQGRWMIKDMEVHSFPPDQRTRLRVDDLQTDVP